jgi:acetyl-CoA carboxylase biotin carboxyl carrier protein
MNENRHGPAGMSSDDHLRKLSDEARRLAANVTGSLRSIRLRSGAATVELEWENTGSAESPRSLSIVDEPVASEEHQQVYSPMVGTFYLAGAPGEPPFVAVGDQVEPDTVIGIIEAMKLMNRITADRHGVVREVLVANGQPVEFEQPLVVLDPPAPVGEV